MSMLTDSTGLASPFNTPTSKRFSSQFDTVSPPSSTPRLARFRTPLGPSHLNTSPAAVGSSPPVVMSLLKKRLEPIFYESRKAAPPTASFSDLPIELVQRIHLLSSSPHLPVVNRQTRYALSNASPTYIANFMLHHYRYFPSAEILTRAVRRPIVTLEVVKEMLRLWDLRHEQKESSRPLLPDPVTPQRPPSTHPPLVVTELPRRLLRAKTAGMGVHPFVRYLMKEFEPSPNKHRGFPLQRAAMDGNYELAEFLLAHGADPRLRDNLAVTAAIDKKNLRMVKLLIEPAQPEDSPRGKKRRLADRVTVTPGMVQRAMKYGSQDIVEYFVHEKHAMPPLNNIMALGEDDVRH